MMKKFFLTVSAIAAVCFSAAAADKSNLDWERPQYRTYTIFNLGILPKIPGWQDNTETIGIKTGWPVVTGKNATMIGFESSWAYSGSEYMTGVQGSMLMNYNKHGEGFEAAIGLNFSSRSFVGMQASCVFNLANNLVGVQAGALNICRTMDGFQPGVIGNITEESAGCQAGLFSITKVLKGCQVGGLNLAKDSTDGFQVGFFNIASGGKGLQFGLVNIIPGGKIPFMLFFNMSK